MMHRLAYLQAINSSEYSGNFGLTTRLKLLPKIRNYFSYTNGMSVRGVRFDNIEKDIFGYALESSVINTEFNVGIFSGILKARYDYEISKSAGDILGLDKSHTLHNYPAWCIVLPWDSNNVDTIFQQYPNDLSQTRKENFLDFLSDDRKYVLDHVYSYEAAESQALQTKMLFESISSKGITESTSLPKVIILRDRRKWKWMMAGQGNHRAYLFNLLKYRYIYAEVNQFVDVSNVESWFNVKNGLFTEFEAKLIFDKVMKGTEVVRGII